MPCSVCGMMGHNIKSHYNESNDNYGGVLRRRRRRNVGRPKRKIRASRYYGGAEEVKKGLLADLLKGVDLRITAM